MARRERLIDDSQTGVRCPERICHGVSYGPRFRWTTQRGTLLVQDLSYFALHWSNGQSETPRQEVLRAVSRQHATIDDAQGTGRRRRSDMLKSTDRSGQAAAQDADQDSRTGVRQWFGISLRPRATRKTAHVEKFCSQGPGESASVTREGKQMLYTQMIAGI